MSPPMVPSLVLEGPARWHTEGPDSPPKKGESQSESGGCLFSQLVREQEAPSVLNHRGGGGVGGGRHMFTQRLQVELPQPTGSAHSRRPCVPSGGPSPETPDSRVCVFREQPERLTVNACLSAVGTWPSGGT